jgi:tetratricopeptide (TPR) repeat protein
LSVPIYDLAIANEALADMAIDQYYSCCGKSICGGCVHSFNTSGNIDKCPFCNSDRSSKTEEELVAEMMKRVAANDAGAMNALGSYYFHGPMLGLSQDEEKAMELWKQAAKLGSSDAYHHMGVCYDDGGDLKKAKFHYEEAAMAGHEDARFNLGLMDIDFEGKRERAIKNMTIAASAGHYKAMQILIKCFERDYVSRKSINSTLTAYNNLCVEMRSEARDAFILLKKETQGYGRG